MVFDDGKVNYCNYYYCCYGDFNDDYYGRFVALVVVEEVGTFCKLDSVHLHL